MSNNNIQEDSADAQEPLVSLPKSMNRRPWIIVSGGQTDRIVLNVAGPRESGSPGIFGRAKKTLLQAFACFRNYSGGDLSSIDDEGNLVAWIDAEFVGER